jgi:putative transposase
MPDDIDRRRRSLRLQGYDYSQAGAYFVTICTRNRIALFGEVTNNDVRLNRTGMIVKETWDALPAHYPNIALDSFVVMPNRIHGIILLGDESGPQRGIPEIVRGFKTYSARRVNESRDKRDALWQRGYYEHVIRNEKSLDRIRGYITSNPARWADDPDNISEVAPAVRGRVKNPPLQWVDLRISQRRAMRCSMSLMG